MTILNAHVTILNVRALLSALVSTDKFFLAHIALCGAVCAPGGTPIYMLSGVCAAVKGRVFKQFALG